MILFCAVCFGGADPIVRDSLNAGIFVLLGTTGLVLACFGWFFMRLAQRARMTADLGEPEAPIDDVFGSSAPLSAFRK